MSKITESLDFLKSEHNSVKFVFNFSKIITGGKWFLFVSDYDLYTSEDFKMSLESIRTKFPTFRFVCAYLKDTSNIRGVIIK